MYERRQQNRRRARAQVIDERDILDRMQQEVHTHQEQLQQQQQQQLQEQQQQMQQQQLQQQQQQMQQQQQLQEQHAIKFYWRLFGDDFEEPDARDLQHMAEMDAAWRQSAGMEPWCSEEELDWSGVSDTDDEEDDSTREHRRRAEKEMARRQLRLVVPRAPVAGEGENPLPGGRPGVEPADKAEAPVPPAGETSALSPDRSREAEVGGRGPVCGARRARSLSPGRLLGGRREADADQPGGGGGRHDESQKASRHDRPEGIVMDQENFADTTEYETFVDDGHSRPGLLLIDPRWTRTFINISKEEGDDGGVPIKEEKEEEGDDDGGASVKEEEEEEEWDEEPERCSQQRTYRGYSTESEHTWGTVPIKPTPSLTSSEQKAPGHMLRKMKRQILTEAMTLLKSRPRNDGTTRQTGPVSGSAAPGSLEPGGNVDQFVDLPISPAVLRPRLPRRAPVRAPAQELIKSAVKTAAALPPRAPTRPPPLTTGKRKPPALGCAVQRSSATTARKWQSLLETLQSQSKNHRQRTSLVRIKLSDLFGDLSNLNDDDATKHTVAAATPSRPTCHESTTKGTASLTEQLPASSVILNQAEKPATLTRPASPVAITDGQTTENTAPRTSRTETSSCTTVRACHRSHDDTTRSDGASARKPRHFRAVLRRTHHAEI
ncbi:misshapen-like kinase 1 [Solenopsis invicta]|uniref:misshapen-like kinase 1 n=1 Tax=Solenopsis invicta TaxID=13686 RepID=UPI00193EB2E0|nr:misshapen-like kinase 1 [Solenopsis invicta]